MAHSDKDGNTIMRIAMSIALLPLALISSIDAQTEVMIQANKDNTLYQSNTGALSNGKGAYFFAGKTGGGSIRRGLFAFDIAGNIENGSSIDSVILTLRMSRTNSNTSRIIALHKILSNWGEGNSNALGEEGSGAASMNGDATWIHTFHDTQFWTNTGGDFSEVESAAASVGAINFYTWSSTPELVADVQSWLDSPSTNYGWILIGDEIVSTTAKRFDSKENSTESNRPKLRVFYSPFVAVTTLGGELPTRYDLGQNYPNPFNPVTRIEYSIPQPGEVSLVIYNLLGEEVSRLVHGHMPIGTYSVIWNASNVASGIYFYRLEAGDFVQTRKMVLLK